MVLFMRIGFVRTTKLLQKDFSALSFHIKNRFIWEPFSKEQVYFLEDTIKHLMLSPNLEKTNLNCVCAQRMIIIDNGLFKGKKKRERKWIG